MEWYVLCGSDPTVVAKSLITKYSYDAPPSLEAVDTSENVDGVCGEDSEEAHVDVVEDAQVDRGAEEAAQRQRHHNLRPVCRHEVDHQEGQRCHRRQQQLVAPSSNNFQINTVSQILSLCYFPKLVFTKKKNADLRPKFLVFRSDAFVKKGQEPQSGDHQGIPK